MNEIEWIARGIAVQDGRVLLCRSVKAGYTYLPGGHVEFGESATGALCREFLEETGLDVRVGESACSIEVRFRQGGKDRHEVSVLFHVEHAGGAWPIAVPSLEAKIAFDWVAPNEFEQADLRPVSIRGILQAYLRGERVPAYLADPAPPPPPA